MKLETTTRNETEETIPEDMPEETPETQEEENGQEQQEEKQARKREHTGRYLVLISDDNKVWTTVGEYDKQDGEVRKQAIQANRALQDALTDDEPPFIATVPVANFKISRPRTQTRESLTFE
jgi:hypothetical protein